MGLLAPLFLLAAAAVTVPFLLHLLHRHEGQRVSFPALRYLLRTEKEHARRIKFRQLVLLILRVAVVLLLVLAGARLFVRGPGSGHDPTAVALILDNSMSSGVVAGEERVLDGLERLALETVAQGTADDRIWVIRAGQPWDAAPSGTPAEAAQRIRDTEVSSASGDLSAALVRARELLLASDLRSREIHLLSDLQSTAFPRDGATRPAGDLTVVLYQPVDEIPTNRYLHDAAVGGGLPPLAGQRTEISLMVGATDISERAEVPLRLIIDGRIQGASATLPGRGVTLPIGPFPVGLVTGYVETDPDALGSDDRRHFAFQVRPPPSVATVGGETFFLEQALSVLADGGRLRRADPGAADVLFSLGGDGIAPRLGRALAIFPPSDPTLLPALNRALAGAALPWRVERREAEGEAEPSESFLPVDMSGVRVRMHYALRPSEGTGGEVLVRLSSGEAWVVTGTSAAGPYVLFGSPLDEAATTLPVSAAMMPLLEWMTALGSASGVQVRRLEAGDPLTVSPLATHVRMPDGSTRPVDPTSVLRETQQAGPYAVLRNDSLLEVLTVGPPLRESLLARLEEQSREERIGPELRVVEDADDWGNRIFVSRQGPELWRGFLVAAVILLLIESWVAAPGATGPTARVPRAEPAEEIEGQVGARVS